LTFAVRPELKVDRSFERRSRACRLSKRRTISVATSACCPSLSGVSPAPRPWSCAAPSRRSLRPERFRYHAGPAGSRRRPAAGRPLPRAAVTPGVPRFRFGPGRPCGKRS